MTAVMNDDENRYSIEQLCQLAGVTRRTVRFYVQSGLLDRPHGEKRGAWYDKAHLDRLIAIRKWSAAGLSLEAIVALLEDGQSDMPRLKPLRVGSVEVRSHLMVAEGVELVVSPERAGLSPEQLREFLRRVGEVYDAITTEKHDGQE